MYFGKLQIKKNTVDYVGKWHLCNLEERLAFIGIYRFHINVLTLLSYP